MIYLWKCNYCDSNQEVQRPIADHAMPPEECTECPPWSSIAGSVSQNLPSWTRVYEAPMQMKASFPDGHKRKGWTDLKESARLEKAAAVARPETKREIKAEIRKMGIKPGTN